MQQRCPICSVDLPANRRYPRYLCATCAAKAQSVDGRRLTFSNADLSGGFVASYLDTGEEHLGHECFVEGVKCRADEAYLGGIVVVAMGSKPKISR